MAAHGCRRVSIASLALAVLCCAGCVHDIFGGKEASGLAPGGTAPPATAAKTTDAAAGQSLAAPTQAARTTPADGRAAATAPAGKYGRAAPLPGAPELRGEQLAEVIEGLQALERLDPQSRATVQASLDRTHPMNWPYVFRFHRAALGSGGKAIAAAPGAANPATATAATWGFPANEATIPAARTSRNPASPTQATPTEASSRDSHSSQPPANRSVASRPQPAKDSQLALSPAKSAPRRNVKPTRESDDRADLADDRQPGTHSGRQWWPAAFHEEETATATRDEGDATPPGQWEQHLHRAIQSLEAQTHDGDDRYGQALLRVLYAVAGRRDDALRPIPNAGEAEREFWVNEMRGLTECLDKNETGSPDRRAAEAARWFRDAAGRLAQMGALELRNLAFCTAVHSFGSMDRFAKYEFQPGEAVLLYAEIENFASESTKAGHRTALKARYDLLDGPRRVHEQDLPIAEETCERQRRDFFVSYRLHLPSELKPGEYTLQLTIDDTVGRKTATRSIGLRIK